jgi:CHAT domain-containing protein
MSGTHTTLIELYWHDDCLRTFVVRPTGQIEMLSLPLSRGRLAEYVRSFRSAFHEGDFHQQQSGAWNELSTTWLERQLGSVVETSSRIVIIPHGSFHHLPLHLLGYKDRPLAVERPVTYCPSATLLVACRNRNGDLRDRSSRALSIGVDFEDEAIEVSKATGGLSPWLESRGEVNKPKVLAGLAGHRLVHFSCHGVFDLEQPMRSGLFLDRVGDRHLSLPELRDQPNFLSASEIAQSHINASLVTLSACETAQAENLPGDEILGLTRALFLAGAACVVVSFWPVPADATRDFMAAFYQSLLADGASVAGAMQASYVSTAAKYSDPAEWGGFAVMGDGLSPWTSH